MKKQTGQFFDTNVGIPNLNVDYSPSSVRYFLISSSTS
jgi:hypothetical protein